jgi:hypothetical protein
MLALRTLHAKAPRNRLLCGYSPLLVGHLPVALLYDNDKTFASQVTVPYALAVDKSEMAYQLTCRHTLPKIRAWATGTLPCSPITCLKFARESDACTGN